MVFVQRNWKAPQVSLSLNATAETWPLREAFTIARGAKTVAEVIVVTVRDGTHEGRGEGVPYPRYGESVGQSLAAIEAARNAIEAEPQALATLLPPGAARNAVDCALIDLGAKRANSPAWQMLGCDAPGPTTTCFTISLDRPEIMAAKARAAAHMPLLKLKLGGDGDAERLSAVRAAVPQARLVVDANEAWEPAMLAPLLAACAASGVELVEQPLPAGRDTALAGLTRPVPVCADESVHTSAGVAALADRYDAVNIKLDKSGGLTEALRLARAAREAGLSIMVGCMVATSLSMAPALLLARGARWVDLDGPLLLARDREGGIVYRDGMAYPSNRRLWG
jgi:L-alanine-DL-glutamate epimerase-like enolase superfamily enzyme